MDFSANMTETEFRAYISQKIDSGLKLGVELGWWESVDWTKREPVPWPTRLKISELEPHELTMAHIMHKIGAFNSVGDARRNGWSKPVEHGEFKYKKTQRLIIEP